MGAKAEAQRKSDELVQKAKQEAQNASRDADASVNAENDRLRHAKEATAEFVAAVEAQIAQQQKVLEALKKLDLPMDKVKPVRKAYDYEAEKDPPRPQPEKELPRTQSEKPEDIAARIEQSVASITGEAVRPKPEKQPDPKAPTKVMPALDERTTAKFANLKFGKNYQPQSGNRQ